MKEFQTGESVFETLSEAFSASSNGRTPNAASPEGDSGYSQLHYSNDSMDGRNWESGERDSQRRISSDSWHNNSSEEARNYYREEFSENALNPNPLNPNPFPRYETKESFNEDDKPCEKALDSGISMDKQEATTTSSNNIIAPTLSPKLLEELSSFEGRTNKSPVLFSPFGEVAESSLDCPMLPSGKKMEDPDFWKSLRRTMEDQQKIVSEKVAEIENERSRRRLAEDELSATRIRLIRAEKVLKVHQSSEEPSQEPKASTPRPMQTTSQNDEALRSAKEQIRNDAVQIRRLQSRLAEMEAKLSEGEAGKNYFERELVTARERIDYATKSKEIKEQELKAARSRWLKEKRELEGKHAAEFSDLKQQLSNALNENEALKMELDEMRRESRDKQLSMQEQLDSAEARYRMSMERMLVDDEDMKGRWAEKEMDILRLKRDLEISTAKCEELEAQLSEMDDAFDERFQSQTSAENDRIKELEDDLGQALEELEIVGARLTEANNNIEILKKDCGQLQKALKQKGRLSDNRLEALQSELEHEKSQRERRICSEVEARTKAFNEEIDSLIELRTNEKAAELRSKYEKALLKTKHQLTQELKRDGRTRNELETAVNKHEATIQSLEQDISQVIQLLASPGVQPKNSRRQQSCPVVSSQVSFRDRPSCNDGIVDRRSKHDECCSHRHRLFSCPSAAAPRHAISVSSDDAHCKTRKSILRASDDARENLPCNRMPRAKQTSSQRLTRAVLEHLNRLDEQN